MSGDLTPGMVETSTWTDEDVLGAGIPMVDSPFISIGSGLGSLALVDTLRLAGVPADQMRVLGRLRRPYENYSYLARNSQIPDHERLRSDAGSVMDNLWGFPSYAWREGWTQRSWKPFWNVFSEPFGAEYYTPEAGQVYASVDRETARIGWNEMLVPGQVRAVRPRHGGGYFVVLTLPGEPGHTQRVVHRARFVHLAVGYAGVRFLPDLQEYRERTRDYSGVVNAYEPHDGVYEGLRRRPGTVLVRGSGIVGSRILQRLLDDVEHHGARTTVVHLFRTYVDGPQGDSATFRRPGGHGFAYQAFNFPKSAWGGQLRDQLESLDDQGRRELVGRMGGTNTPYRKTWRDQLARARSRGNYHQLIGEVTRVDPAPGGGVSTTVRLPSGDEREVVADVVIDATGLVGDIRDNRLLGDLLDHAGATRNAMGRLAVTDDLEVQGTRSEPGRLYASGSITLGGPYAGVDSFLGLQYVALRIADDLARTGWVPRIGPGRSIAQWWRWARNRTPEGRTPAPVPLPDGFGDVAYRPHPPPPPPPVPGIPPGAGVPPVVDEFPAGATRHVAPPPTEGRADP